MYVANISFSRAEGVPRDQISHTINAFLAALRMNGQVCGREWPISISDSQYQVTVLLPAQDALEHTHMNHYVEHALEHIHILGLNEPSIFVCGEDIDSITCTCSKIDTYILYTTYLSLESPLRCGTCFGTIPLYSVPPTYDGEYYDIIVWQSDYQACDSLQMNCSTLERATLRELTQCNSSLSHQGRTICHKLMTTTCRPTYYYLYPSQTPTRKKVADPSCPSCGQPWRLEKSWHAFDFKCDICYLLSAKE